MNCVTRRNFYIVVALSIVHNVLSVSQKKTSPKQNNRSHQHIFQDIIEKNIWKSTESKSGTGSTLQQTAVIRKEIPKVIAAFNIQSLLDAACGDFNWMRHVPLGCQYYGVDVVPTLIKHNQMHFASKDRTFKVADISKDLLPKVDVILCRDNLVHLSYDDIKAVLLNFKKSGSKYLLTTTFTQRFNRNINTGEWRPINLQLPPFNFPEPVRLINEKCTEGTYSDKSLGLWLLSDIKI
jgi:hypothetical protein